MAKLICNNCGKTDDPENFMDTSETRRAMEAHGVCFGCGYWRLEITKPHPTVIAGCIYSVGNRPKGGRSNGMAGRRFDIEYFDGRAVTTYDLWSGSEVPDRYKHLIPDTARFAGGAERVKVGETVCWNPSKATP